MPDELDTAEAFGAIGNEHRVAIVRTLTAAYREDDSPLPYSELKSRIEMRDSGQFNYHLQKLVGRFVSERDGGYALTYAGRKVAAAIASGTLDESASLDPASVEGTCYACGDDALVLRYVDQQVRVTCSSCREEVVHMPFPPAGVSGRSVAELRRDFDRWARSWNALAGGGVCPECSGRMRGELAKEARTPAIGDVDVRAVLSCERCWARGFLPPGMLVVGHPAVVAFFWERGEDIRERSLWQHRWALSTDGQTVTDADPFGVRIELARGDATLSVTVDDSLSVESVVERRER